MNSSLVKGILEDGVIVLGSFMVVIGFVGVVRAVVHLLKRDMKIVNRGMNKSDGVYEADDSCERFKKKGFN